MSNYLRKLSLFSKSKSEDVPDRKRMPENSRSEPILPELPDSLGSLPMNGISENEVQDLRAFPGSGGGRSLGRSRRATQEQRLRRARSNPPPQLGLNSESKPPLTRPKSTGKSSNWLGFRTPLNDGEYLIIFEARPLGFELWMEEGKISHVVAVKSEFCKRSGVQKGDVLKSINGEAFDESASKKVLKTKLQREPLPLRIIFQREELLCRNCGGHMEESWTYCSSCGALAKISLKVLGKHRNTLSHRLFDTFDMDQNGDLDFEEFQVGLQALGVTMTTEDSREIFNGIRKSDDDEGYIHREDIMDFFERRTEPHLEKFKFQCAEVLRAQVRTDSMSVVSSGRSDSENDGTSVRRTRLATKFSQRRAKRVQDKVRAVDTDTKVPGPKATDAEWVQYILDNIEIDEEYENIFDDDYNVQDTVVAIVRGVVQKLRDEVKDKLIQEDFLKPKDSLSTDTPNTDAPDTVEIPEYESFPKPAPRTRRRTITLNPSMQAAALGPRKADTWHGADIMNKLGDDGRTQTKRRILRDPSPPPNPKSKPSSGRPPLIRAATTAEIFHSRASSPGGSHNLTGIWINEAGKKYVIQHDNQTNTIMGFFETPQHATIKGFYTENHVYMEQQWLIKESEGCTTKMEGEVQNTTMYLSWDLQDRSGKSLSQGDLKINKLDEEALAEGYEELEAEI